MKKLSKINLINKTSVILAIFLIVFVFQVGISANEINYPEKPITIINPYSAGGTSDTSTRVISSVIYPKYLDQPIIIINKPGANGAVGIREMVNSKPDGYTLVTCSSSSVLLTPLLLDVEWTYDDLTPICSMLDYAGSLCVRPDAPWKTLKELIDYSRENPNVIRYGSGGTWSMEELLVKTINEIEGIEWVAVPFPGGAETTMAAISGAIDVLVGYGAANTQIKAGLLRPLVVYGDQRLSWLPDVPTLKEEGYDVTSGSTMGVFGPPNLPKDIVEKLEAALKNVFEETDAYQQVIVDKFGLIAKWRGSEEFDNFNRTSIAQFTKTLKDLGEID